MFATSAPNASLIGHSERGADAEAAVVLTLISAAYDPAAATLIYEVMLLDAELITDRALEQELLTVLDTPCEYAEASFFIDSEMPAAWRMERHRRSCRKAWLAGSSPIFHICLKSSTSVCRAFGDICLSTYAPLTLPIHTETRGTFGPYRPVSLYQGNVP
jgi:hypothetical protein